jgi:hypothetical protein
MLVNYRLRTLEQRKTLENIRRSTYKAGLILRLIRLKLAIIASHVGLQKYSSPVC